MCSNFDDEYLRGEFSESNYGYLFVLLMTKIQSFLWCTHRCFPVEDSNVAANNMSQKGTRSSFRRFELVVTFEGISNTQASLTVGGLKSPNIYLVLGF